MNKPDTMRDFWNSRANVKGNYGPPLNLTPKELAFHQKHLVRGGDALILGATPALCTIAREVCKSVLAVDYAEDIIGVVKIDGVNYACEYWEEFLAENPQKFHNILTDGGMTCLDFPKGWKNIAQQIGENLQPSGVFTAKIYISQDEPPTDSLVYPSFNRFMNQVPRPGTYAVTPRGPDYERYPFEYTIPPEPEVLKTFGALALRGEFTDSYDKSEYFKSYAWQLPA